MEAPPAYLQTAVAAKICLLLLYLVLKRILINPPQAKPPNITEQFTNYSKNYSYIEGFNEGRSVTLQGAPADLLNTLQTDIASINSEITSINSLGSGNQQAVNNLRAAIQEARGNIEQIEAQIQTETQDLPSQPQPSYTQAVDRLRNLAQMRINMLDALLATYVQATNNSALTRVNLIDQKTLQQVAQENIINAQKTLNNLNNRKTANQRLAEINTYYAKNMQEQV